MNEAFIKNIGIMNANMTEELENSLIVIFGLGGVGGFTFESLVRAGIGNFLIIDKDNFELTNLNRQLAATYDTIGLAKVVVYKNRALSINNNINVIDLCVVVNKENINAIFNYISKFNNIKKIYIADCIDDVEAKICIIEKCYNEGLNIISCMGTANHKNSEKIKIDKLLKSKYCPLAKKIRNKLNFNKNINPNVLFIDEEQIDISLNVSKDTHISTIQYIPAICGMKIAEFIINDLIFIKK